MPHLFRERCLRNCPADYTPRPDRFNHINVDKVSGRDKSEILRIGQNLIHLGRTTELNVLIHNIWGLILGYLWD